MTPQYRTNGSDASQKWYIERMYKWIDYDEWLSIRGPFLTRERAEQEMRKLEREANDE